MTTALLAKRPQSPIALIHREHKQLLDILASKTPTRVRCCAAQLISYFKHWHDWKQKIYPTDWVYQPLTEIRHDLMDAFTIHVVREAIALLQSLNFLSVRKNDRAINWRNGQDKTHQYHLQSDRISAALENCFQEPMAETLEKSPFVNVETPSVNVEISRVNVEIHTQIPYSDSCIDSFSLSEEAREKLELTEKNNGEVTQNELNSINNGEVTQNELNSINDLLEELQEDCDNNINSGVDQFSAAPALNCVELLQDNVEPLPKLKNDSEALLQADRTSGFRSDTERDGFYQALLELGKSKGKKSPAAWSSVIVKSIDGGGLCQYLNEYREGLLLGICEQQEWEVAPGQPREQFVTYLKTKNQKTGMTDEEAIALVHRQLENTNLAKSLWESCKRTIVRCQDDWEKQKRLGVATPYVPSELLPPQEVTLEQAAIALQSLSSNSVSAQALTSSDIKSSLKAVVEPAPTDTENSSQINESPTPENSQEKPTLTELQSKLNSPLQASVVRAMVNANPQWGYRIDADLRLVLPAEGQPRVEYLQWLLDSKLTAGQVRQLVARNPKWGFLIDEDGCLWDF